MKMCLCPNNHYYDQSIYSACPHCVGGPGVGKTMPVADPYQGAPGKTMPVAGPYQGSPGKAMPAGPHQGDPAKTVTMDAAVAARPPVAGMRADGGRNAAAIDIGQTRAVAQYMGDLDPVVGWLVCVDGKNRGRDYRIHADNNYIGRDPGMDIALSDDDAVSRQNHAIISYDTRDRAYYFAQGTGRGIVRVNGKATLSTMQLEAYDLLEIGETRLVFIPLCGEAFDWLEKGL